MKVKSLELIHLVNYLPYKINPLKIKWHEGIYTLDGLTGAWSVDIRQAMHVTRVHVETIKPIIRPLSDLYDHPADKEINTICNGFIGVKYFHINDVPYKSLQILCKHHFDVFGLIENKLAIDINTLVI